MVQYYISFRNKETSININEIYNNVRVNRYHIWVNPFILQNLHLRYMWKQKIHKFKILFSYCLKKYLMELINYYFFIVSCIITKS